MAPGEVPHGAEDELFHQRVEPCGGAGQRDPLSTSLDAQSLALTLFLLAAWHSSLSSYRGSALTYSWVDSLTLLADMHRAI